MRGGAEVISENLLIPGPGRGRIARVERHLRGKAGRRSQSLVQMASVGVPLDAGDYFQRAEMARLRRR